jgi:predicted nucleic acid-binding protein
LFVKVRTLLAEDFADQVLPFDDLTAVQYADIVASRERSGRPISMADAQTAALCRHWSAGIATRNITDFTDTGIHVGQSMGYRRAVDALSPRETHCLCPFQV